MESKRFVEIAGVIILTAALLVACSDSKEEAHTIRFTYEFTNGVEGWEAGFADYPVGDDDFYELSFEHATLPAPLNSSDGVLKISGNNHSDDLFMYVKKKIGGLEANTSYEVSMMVEFATNVPDGMFGVGGSPGESVYIKAGATTIEPEREADALNWYRMNIDNANQAQSGADMVVLGDFSNDTNEEIYVLKTVNSAPGFIVFTDNNGEAWLIVGSDSGFEATTTVHYNRFEFDFTEQV